MAKRGVWTGLRLRQISARLLQVGLHVAPNTVRRLLAKLGLALHANRKSLCSSHPERHRQFRYIARQGKQFSQANAPIISVDAKKRELVGNFKNPGRVWSQQAIPVNGYDFPSLSKGVAIPYGVLDMRGKRGYINLGTSCNTPAFAAASIRKWWLLHGRTRYPKATRLLILADGGGSNASTTNLWKHALQEKLADPFGLFVTVCHYPTGASKWNPVEHQLFSEITKQWAGQPLVDYPTILRLIRRTRTDSGLTVTCSLDKRRYPTGIKLTPEQRSQITLYKHAVLPDWNYTLFPNENGN